MTAKLSGWWEEGVVILSTHSIVTGQMQSDRLFNRRFHADRRKALRANLTPAEARLWSLLQRSQLEGRKFRRQHGVGPYIVDFYCAEERLVIELEGSAHDSSRSATLDNARERFLRAAGLTVLRLENRHISENPHGVLEWIKRHFLPG